MFRLMKELMLIVPELKGKFYLSAFLKVMESFFAGVPYGILILTLRDLLSGTLSREKVGVYTACAAACFLVQGLFFYLFSRTAYPAGSRLAEQIRLIVGEHIRKLPMGYFSKRSTGDLNAMVADELMMVSHIPTMAFPQLISGITIPAVIVAFLAGIDWRLTLVPLAFLPPGIYFFLIGQKRLRQGVKKRSASLIDISATTIEYVQGMEVIKAFQQTGRRFARFSETLKRFKEDNLTLVLSAVPPLAFFQTFLDLGFSAVLFFCIYFLMGGEITIFTFLVFLILGLRIYEPLKGLNHVYELIRLTEVTIQRIRQVLDMPPLPQSFDEGVPEYFDIEFDNVTFSYGTHPVLKNISFKIPEKSITAVVGPSGAGKTTITNLIARFWDVDQGEIRIGGRRITSMGVDDLLSLVSLVFQDIYLFNDTIYNNIACGSRNTTKEKILAAARTARCHNFIKNLEEGYDTMVGEGGATLSGGEKQRIAIARALLKDAPIILLDEATASVDPENERLIQEGIHAMVESKTLVIIAHRLSTITSADQIILLNESGGVEETGRHDELLMGGGLYSRLWESRQKAREWRIKEKRERPLRESALV